MKIFFPILQWIFVLVEIILIAFILLRKADVSGLSSTFGGIGGDNPLGVKTQKQFDKTITYISVVFLVLCIFLNRYHSFAKPTPTEPQKKESTEEPGKKN